MRAARSPQPQAGDRLAYMMGEHKGQKIAPADLTVGGDPTLAYPLDPASGEVVASRANLIAVMRVDPASLSDEVRTLAPDGVVAYSALCTHYGCLITAKDDTGTHLVCNCHRSVFDVGGRGSVVSGPAKRRLAMLPLALEGDELVVTAPFDGPLGPPL